MSKDQIAENIVHGSDDEDADSDTDEESGVVLTPRAETHRAISIVKPYAYNIEVLSSFKHSSFCVIQKFLQDKARARLNQLTVAKRLKWVSKRVATSTLRHSIDASPY